MKALRLGYVIIFLWAIDHFIFKNLKFDVLVSTPALVTTIICVVIVMAAVVIPFLLRKD